MFSLLWRAASCCLILRSRDVPLSLLTFGFLRSSPCGVTNVVFIAVQQPDLRISQRASERASSFGSDFKFCHLLENGVAIYCFLYKICISGAKCWEYTFAAMQSARSLISGKPWGGFPEVFELFDTGVATYSFCCEICVSEPESWEGIFASTKPSIQLG